MTTEDAAIKPGMPGELVSIVSTIKNELEPAKQSATITEGDGEGAKVISYSSADDIFEAIRKKMAENKLICELLDGGFEINTLDGGGVLINAKFIPVLSTPSLVYDDERNAVHMVAMLESMNTAAAIRTLAEKTYLRNLFKLPSAKGEAEQSAARPSAQAPAHEEEETAGRERMKAPRAVRNPLMLAKDASEKLRDEHLRRLTDITSNTSGEDVIAQIDDLWKQISPEWAKLQAYDKQLVKVAITKARETQESEAA